MRADLAHHGAIRLLDAALDPASIRPKRRYRRTQYFARAELSRLCLNALREAGEPVSADDVTGRVMVAKTLDGRDADLRVAMRV